MRSDLSKRLIEAGGDSLCGRRSAVRNFHFECNNGWYAPLYAALTVATRISEEDDQELVISQIKEKFAELRIYSHCENKEIDNAFGLAETFAASMCEICGELGYPKTSKSWVSVRCSEHEESDRTDDAFQLDERFSEELVLVFEAAVRKLGKESSRWFLKANPEIGNEQPLALLIEKKDCQKILDLLNAIPSASP